TTLAPVVLPFGDDPMLMEQEMRHAVSTLTDNSLAECVVPVSGKKTPVLHDSYPTSIGAIPQCSRPHAQRQSACIALYGQRPRHACMAMSAKRTVLMPVVPIS